MFSIEAVASLWKTLEDDYSTDGLIISFLCLIK